MGSNPVVVALENMCLHNLWKSKYPIKCNKQKWCTSRTKGQINIDKPFCIFRLQFQRSSYMALCNPRRDLKNRIEKVKEVSCRNTSRHESNSLRALGVHIWKSLPENIKNIHLICALKDFLKGWHWFKYYLCGGYLFEHVLFRQYFLKLKT